MRSPWIVLCLAMASALMGQAQAQQSETLYVKRASDLRQGPTDTTAVVVALPAQSAVARLTERVGPWMKVKTEAGQTGWIHMFDVGTVPVQSTAGSTASGALRGLTNFFKGGGSSGATTTATSTVGIRGLGAEDIANAQPNLDALKKIEAARVDAAGAKRFATESQLAARAVDPLPTPEPPAPPPSEANSGEGSAKKGSNK